MEKISFYMFNENPTFKLISQKNVSSHFVKQQVHEGEFRLSKLPLEIQEFVAPEFYKKQNLYRDIGRELKKKYEELSKLVEKHEQFINNLTNHKRQLLQLAARIGTLFHDLTVN